MKIEFQTNLWRDGTPAVEAVEINGEVAGYICSEREAGRTLKSILLQHSAMQEVCEAAEEALNDWHHVDLENSDENIVGRSEHRLKRAIEAISVARALLGEDNGAASAKEGGKP